MPKGKKQMLCILDEKIIERIKIAAVKKDARISHVVEQALSEWLARWEETGAGAADRTA